MRYKHRPREDQPGEHVFEVSSTAGKAEQGGGKKLTPDDIWASEVPLELLSCTGNISSLLFPLERVGFLSFVSIEVMTNPPTMKAEEKLCCNTFSRGLNCASTSDRTVAWLELELALLCGGAHGTCHRWSGGVSLWVTHEGAQRGIIWLIESSLEFPFLPSYWNVKAYTMQMAYFINTNKSRQQMLQGLRGKEISVFLQQ